MNGEQVQLIPIPAAHTDGDTLVKFVNADVIMSGDFYRSLGYPNIDRANGGSLNGMLAGLAKIADLSGPSTKIVPGHGVVVDGMKFLRQPQIEDEDRHGDREDAIGQRVQAKLWVHV